MNEIRQALTHLSPSYLNEYEEDGWVIFRAIVGDYDIQISTSGQNSVLTIAQNKELILSNIVPNKNIIQGLSFFQGVNE